MRIAVLRKMRYEGTFIYIMQFATEFQYLFSWFGDIYQDHRTMKPNKWRWLMWKLNRRDAPYTAEELEEGEKIMLSCALSTIDKIKEDGRHTRQAKRERDREHQKMQKEMIARTGKPCQWQAIDSVDGFYYRCLTHGVAVKMEDGKKPVHDVLIPSPFV